MAETEMRCTSGVLFAHLDDGVFKVKCRHWRCGASLGVVIIHHFSAMDGSLLATKVYSDPAVNTRKEARAHAAQ